MKRREILSFEDNAKAIDSPVEMSVSEAASWERVEKLRELISSATRDLETAIASHSPTRLSSATQSVSNAGLELTRLLGRIEEAQGR